MSTTFNCPACQQLIAAEVDPGTQVMCPLCRQTICPSTTDRGCSYHYVPGYGTTSDPTQIIAYDDPANHQGQGGNILYVDGHVAWVPSPKFEADIAAIKLPNGKPWKPYKEDEQSDEEPEVPDDDE